ncbi:MAG: F0F1 ATP synthase subunit delta [Gammaproteobacteria bacterium]
MAELTTIARPYAQAIFELAHAEDRLPAWSDMLALAAAVVADPQIEALIDSPQLTEEQLSELLTGICGERLDEHGRNVIRLLAENHRLAMLPEIARLYEQRRSQAEGAVHAQLISAFAATDAQQAAVIEALKKRLGRDIQLECSVDTGLLGGAVVRAGDLVIDGSVRGRLARLGTALSH